MKHLILGRGRFSNISNIAVKYSKPKLLNGGSNSGHGGYVKKDFAWHWRINSFALFDWKFSS